MINKKDKFRLRSLANPMSAIVTIGKDGITENVVNSINDVIRTHELIKISVLKSFTDYPIKELAEMICSYVKAELIFVVGRVIVIYRKNKDVNKYGVN